MSQTPKCYSVAIATTAKEKVDFFNCVIGKECIIEFFSNDELNLFLTRAAEFSILFIDIPAAHWAKASGLWASIIKELNGRLFILTDRDRVVEYRTIFSKDAESFPFPFTTNMFLSALDNSENPENKTTGLAIEKPAQPSSIKTPSKDISCDTEYKQIFGRSEKMQEVKNNIFAVLDNNYPLVFLGESGVGKTSIAEIAHKLSQRKNKSFVTVNMANCGNNFIESILFGTVRGAFTDARPRKGLFKKADGGTLFMDEIAETSPECQAELLRVIDTKTFRPMGLDEEVKVDVQLFFATNANLEEMMKLGTFREDLYWRIMVFPITIPALRERVEDIPDLFKNALNKIPANDKNDITITDAALEKLCSFDWPGNIRQLTSCAFRAWMLSRDNGVIDEESIIF